MSEKAAVKRTGTQRSQRWEDAGTPVTHHSNIALVKMNEQKLHRINADIFCTFASII